MTVSSTRPSGAVPRRTSASIAARNAVSVLPDPVGAATSVSRPAWIAGQAADWASVGPEKVRRNQPETAGWKASMDTLGAGLLDGTGRDGPTHESGAPRCGMRGLGTSPSPTQIGLLPRISTDALVRPCRRIGQSNA